MEKIDNIRKSIYTDDRNNYRKPIPTCLNPDRCEFCLVRLNLDNTYYVNLPIVECYICSNCYSNFNKLVNIIKY